MKVAFCSKPVRMATNDRVEGGAEKEEEKEGGVLQKLRLFILLQSRSLYRRLSRYPCPVLFEFQNPNARWAFWRWERPVEKFWSTGTVIVVEFCDI